MDFLNPDIAVRHRSLRFPSEKMYLYISLLMSISYGILVLWGTKTAFVIIVSISLILVYIVAAKKLGFSRANRYTLYFIIFSVPFPIMLQLEGSDAVTLTTVLIFFLLGLLLVNKFISDNEKRLRKKYLYLLPSLIILSLTVSFIFNPVYIGQSLRYYVANLSGIGLYFLVLAIIKKPQDLVQIMKIVLIALLFQVVVAFLQLRFPEIARVILIPFGSRIETGYAPVREGISRANAIIGDYELLAEMFLIGSIFSICLLYVLKKKIYIFLFLCNLLGIVFTKTRSDLILLIFGLFLSYILLKVYRKDYKGNIAKITLTVILGSILILALFPSQITDFEKRLNNYFHTKNRFSAEAFNRQMAWEIGIILVKKPSIFGNGLSKVDKRYAWAKSFHSLYLTILYKIGLFGTFAYLIFWITLLLKSWNVLSAYNKRDYWYILFFLLISVILILIDGIKIEFLRYSHTIQFAWLIFAMLAVTLEKNEDMNENIMVPSASV